MTSTLFLLTLTVLVAAEPEKTPRKPSGIAPSLPALTKEEEEKLDDIIDRLIRADTGRLRGEEARRRSRSSMRSRPRPSPPSSAD